MKKLLLLLSLIIVLISCSKEYSYEKECGVIISKKANTPIINSITFILKVQYKDYIKDYEIKLLSYDQYQVGDKYCQ